jgi:hypothetical protein
MKIIDTASARLTEKQESLMNKLCYLSVLLLTLLVMPFASFAHCEGKHTGNHPHCPGGGEPPDSASCPGDFPAFAYAVEITNKRGHTERSDLKVSNSDGSCEVQVHSVTTADFYSELNFNFDNNSDLYRIAYIYPSDEADTRNTGNRPNIRILEFSVSSDLGETKIDQVLPLEPKKIYRYSGNSSAGRGIIGLDLSGNSLVFGLEYGIQDGPKRDPDPLAGWYDSIIVIENISDCIANSGPEPDDRCAQIVFSNIVNQTALNPRWGIDTNRIYFQHGWDSPWSDRGYALIDRVDSDSPWSAPGALYRPSVDGGNFSGRSEAVWNYDGSGPRVVMNAVIDGILQIHDIDSGCNALSSASQSCLFQGSATLVATYPSQTHLGKWTSHTLLGPGPNLLFKDSDINSILEFDPDTATETVIIGGLPRNTWFDPVD